MCLVAASLAAATSEKVVVPALSIAMAAAFSPKGLDDATEIAKFEAMLAKSPEGIRPIAGIDVTVTAKDLALPPREMRIAFFGKMALPLYRGGPEAFGRLATNPKNSKKLADQAGPLGIVSASNHNALVVTAVVLGFVAMLLAVPLVLFSRGSGRLVSAGIVLMVASLPGSAVLTLARLASNRPPPAPPIPEQGIGGMASYVGAQCLPVLLPPMQRVFLMPLLAGFALLVAAAVGSVVRIVRARRAVLSGEPVGPSEDARTGQE
ncbi:MAG: hypothetical protein WC971_09535 [Coriobacteriia bacterium]